MIAGRYTLTDEVGRGGMGVVWRAVDEVLHREVALKRVGLVPGVVSADLARAEREARLAAGLNHPHVVAVFDLVTDGDERWLVMEYVPGPNLAQLVRERGPLSPEAAARILGPVADALAAAHRAGIVHRDVKPSNILVTPDGQVKLTDFGIARAHGDVTLTQTGLMSGSPAYLAPEVASGAGATAASDVWSLGATLYHALTGRPPYEVGGNVMGALYQIVHEEPPRPENAGRLRPLLEATMARDPASRWSMERVRDVLLGGHAGPAVAPPPAPPTAHETAVLPAITPPAPPPEPAEPAEPPEPVEPAEPARSRRTPWLVAGAVVALLLLALTGWALLGGDDAPRAGDRPPGQATPSAPQPSQSPSQSPSPEESASAEEMQAFVEDYLATAPSDPETTWQRLTPRFQQASGGFDGYLDWWGRVASATPRDVRADPETMTVSYQVDYVMRDGSTSSDSVTLALALRDGELYVSGES